MALKTYDPKQVAVIFNGFPLQGFAEDKVVSVKRETPTWSDKSGADGEVVRSKSNDKRGEITISLLQTSASNEVLSTLALADEKTNLGVAPILIKDNSGLSIWAASKAWITGPPESEYANEAGEREWTIRCADLEYMEGGN